MPDTHEYTWRSFSGLFRPSRIVFDFQSRTIEFHNAIRPNGFFNRFFQQHLQCSFEDVTEVDAYTQDGTQCLSVKVLNGNCVYMANDVPRFEQFVDDFLAVRTSKAAA